MSSVSTSTKLTFIQILMLVILSSLFICVHAESQQQSLTQSQYEAIKKVINQRDQKNGKSWNQLQQFIKGLLLPQEIQTLLLNFAKINIEGRAIQNALVQLEKKQSEALTNLFGAISKTAYYALLNTGKQAFGKTKQSLGSLLQSISNAAGETGQFNIKQSLENAKSYLANKIESLELKQNFQSTKDFMYKTIEDFHLGEKKDEVVQKAGQLWEQGKKKWTENFGQSQQRITNKIGNILGSLFGSEQNKSKEQKVQETL